MHHPSSIIRICHGTSASTIHQASSRLSDCRDWRWPQPGPTVHSWRLGQRVSSLILGSSHIQQPKVGCKWHLRMQFKVNWASAGYLARRFYVRCTPRANRKAAWIMKWFNSVVAMGILRRRSGGVWITCRCGSEVWNRCGPGAWSIPKILSGTDVCLTTRGCMYLCWWFNDWSMMFEDIYFMFVRMCVCMSYVCMHACT